MVNVCKYTVRPMDHMGGIAGWTQVLQGDKSAGNPTPKLFRGIWKPRYHWSHQGVKHWQMGSAWEEPRLCCTFQSSLLHIRL